MRNPAFLWKRNLFILIELLVVIAIIAILGGKVPPPGNEAFVAAALPLFLLTSPGGAPRSSGKGISRSLNCS